MGKQSNHSQILWLCEPWQDQPWHFACQNVLKKMLFLLPVFYTAFSMQFEHFWLDSEGLLYTDKGKQRHYCQCEPYVTASVIGSFQ